LLQQTYSIKSVNYHNGMYVLPEVYQKTKHENLA